MGWSFGWSLLLLLCCAQAQHDHVRFDTLVPRIDEDNVIPAISVVAVSPGTNVTGDVPVIPPGSATSVEQGEEEEEDPMKAREEALKQRMLAVWKDKQWKRTAYITSCSFNKDYYWCLANVGCGWCTNVDGINTDENQGKCVDGDTTGPLDADTYCPMYTTMQRATMTIPEDPGDIRVVSDRAANPKWYLKPPPDGKPCDAPEPEPTKEPAVEVPTPEPTAPTPMPLPPPDLNNLPKGYPPQPGMSFTPPGYPPAPPGLTYVIVIGPDGKPKWKLGKMEPYRPSYTTVGHSDSTNFDENLSPCGIPTVPKSLCDAWKKKFCGSDFLDRLFNKTGHAANPALFECMDMWQPTPYKLPVQDRPCISLDCLSKKK